MSPRRWQLCGWQCNEFTSEISCAEGCLIQHHSDSAKAPSDAHFLRAVIHSFSN